MHALKVWTWSIKKNYQGSERELRKKKKKKRIGKKYLMLVDCRQPLAHSLPNPRRRKTHCLVLKVEWFPKFLIRSFVLCFFYINLFDIVGDSSSPLR